MEKERRKRSIICRTGEKKEQNCGQTATIIAYRNASDIDIRFDDSIGTCVYHKRYHDFTEGKIRNPNWHTTKKSVSTRVGTVKRQNCGMDATIIRYGGSNDIDIQFEDGTVKQHQLWSSFINGNIKNPNRKPVKENAEIVTKTGKKAFIHRFRNCQDIDIRLEDGTILQHKTHQQFKNMAAKPQNI